MVLEDLHFELLFFVLNYFKTLSLFMQQFLKIYAVRQCLIVSVLKIIEMGEGAQMCCRLKTKIVWLRNFSS